jgi:PAS domain S-box-containing protein
MSKNMKLKESDLRSKAKQLVRNEPMLTNSHHPEDGMLKIIHDLRVRQLELELQNEKLRNELSGIRKIVDLNHFDGNEEITNHSKIQESLRGSEEKYKALFENSNDAIMLLNQNSFFDCNSQTLKMFRLNSKEEFINFHPAQLSPPFQPNGLSSFEEAQKKITYAFLNGYNRFEWVHSKSNGDDFNAEVLLSVSDFGGERILQATIRDITEQKTIEKELLKEQLFMNTLINSVPGIFYLFSYPDFKMKRWNINNETLLGFTAEELNNLPIESWKTKDQVENVLKGMDEVMKNGHFETELYLAKKDGGSIPFLLSGIRLELFDKTYILGIGIDITERKKLIEDLTKAKEQAEESDRLKSAFLANMSHEIRTPMNGILGFSELLKDPSLSSEKQSEFIKIIEKSGQRLLNTINSIVEISKIESGLVEVISRESNINELTAKVYNILKSESEKKGLNLSFKNSLPEREARIIIDQEKLFSILSTLVKNAIKFTEKGSVEFGYEKKDYFLEFYVKDTGIGIRKEKQEVIFERFVQADIGDKRAYQGVGLGLAISRYYVEILGGRIWLESEEGKGSEFYFTIPYNVELQEKIVFESVVEIKNPGQQNNYISKPIGKTFLNDLIKRYF